MEYFSLSESEIKSLLTEMELIGQPIFAIKKGKLMVQPNEYELLLRSRKVHLFPQQLFNSLVVTKVGNELFWRWFDEELVQIVTRQPQLVFNINIEPQQLFFQSTWNFITGIKKYRSQLHLELTERIPAYNLQPELRDLTLQQALVTIKKVGFFIALDDVFCGQNSLQTVLDLAISLKRIKFSLLDFKRIESSLQLELMKLIFQLASDLQLELVFEGVSFQQIVVALATKFNQPADFIFWQSASEIKL